MNHFEPVADTVYLLKTPFSIVWSGVVLIRGTENILIDSGADSETVDRQIIPALAELGLKPSDIRWLTVTHCHGDHIGGVPRLKQLYPHAKILACEKERDFLGDPRQNLTMETLGAAISVTPDVCVRDGEELIVGTMKLKFLETPGHTRGGMCIFLPEEKILFDMEYIRHRSVMFDIRCLLGTVRVVFRHDGAR